MRNDMDVEQPHSIWLCPDATTYKHLQSTIDVIAEQEGAPSFAPHVTLLGDIVGAPRKTETLCRLAFAKHTAVEARIEGMAMTSHFFMSLFVDLDVPSYVHHLRRELADGLELDVAPDFRPHLSLAYGLESNAQTRQFTRTEPAISNGQKLILDTVVVASSSSQLPINRWKPLSKIKLARTGYWRVQDDPLRV
ncbi:MAG: 2'-5' RNA ligase family protein [Roseobacter sp.]|uniref:2'-5' RNA ligase family protein n=1 Tax=Tateyamaria sp. TaxID=1929288 RepID=UPI00329569A0